MAADGDTSYFCVVDAEGNALSFIHSLSMGFWQRIRRRPYRRAAQQPHRTRDSASWTGHPNVIEGGKRTMHTLNAYMVMRGMANRPWWAARLAETGR